MSQTAYRTHHATEVTEELVGQKVTLSGWVDRRRDHGGVAFIDLRDNTGLVLRVCDSGGGRGPPASGR